MLLPNMVMFGFTAAMAHEGEHEVRRCRLWENETALNVYGTFSLASRFTAAMAHEGEHEVCRCLLWKKNETALNVYCTFFSYGGYSH